jgi:hypothetical protein
MTPEYLTMLLEGDNTLPEPDAVFGIEDDAGDETPSAAPPVSELLLNRDVKAVVDAAEEIEPAATGS